MVDSVQVVKPGIVGGKVAVLYIDFQNVTIFTADVVALGNDQSREVLERHRWQSVTAVVLRVVVEKFICDEDDGLKLITKYCTACLVT